MPNMKDLTPDLVKKLLFVSVFIESNRLQSTLDRNADEISSKQWLLLAMTGAFNEPPSLSEMGEAMGCSRQNVKKIASILEKKGYITLEKAIKDNRTVCIVMTDKYRKYSKKLETVDDEVLDAVFGDFSNRELEEFLGFVQKLELGIKALDAYFARIKK
jgi:MarR family transcriptional regulator, negative regulator of the multidrug operon emrRAB